jgi:hypothetical protein
MPAWNARALPRTGVLGPARMRDRVAIDVVVMARGAAFGASRTLRAWTCGSSMPTRPATIAARAHATCRPGHGPRPHPARLAPFGPAGAFSAFAGGRESRPLEASGEGLLGSEPCRGSPARSARAKIWLKHWCREDGASRARTATSWCDFGPAGDRRVPLHSVWPIQRVLALRTGPLRAAPFRCCLIPA